MSTGSSSAAVTVEVWPTPDGVLHFPLLTVMAAEQRVAAVLDGVAPGSAVVVSDPVVRDGLLGAGARQVRHVHTMRHRLSDVPAPSRPAGIGLRGWQDGDAELLAPALVAAYGAGHPDQRDPDPAGAARSLAAMVDDLDNPLMPEGTRVAESDDGPVGAAVVLRSLHVTGWTGPWLMNVFRHPTAAPSGPGAALVCGALTGLRDAGETHLGLAVTSSNPARHTYERLGFGYDFEGWVLVLPPR